jgi:hypothetical protein
MNKQPLNFDTLADAHPGYNLVWILLRDWFRRHGAKRYAETAFFKRAVPASAVAPELFNSAIEVMLNARMLESAYRVRAPDGSLLEAEFTDRNDIPATLPDRMGHTQVETSECEVVAGYRWFF